MGWLVLLLVLGLAAAGVVASMAAADVRGKLGAVEAAAARRAQIGRLDAPVADAAAQETLRLIEAAAADEQAARAAAALADARQHWLSVMVGLLAGVVLLAFLQVVRLARRPVRPAAALPPDIGIIVGEGASKGG